MWFRTRLIWPADYTIAKVCDYPLRMAGVRLNLAEIAGGGRKMVKLEERSRDIRLWRKLSVTPLSNSQG